MKSPIHRRQRNFVFGLIIIGLMIMAIFGLRTMRAFREFHGLPPPRPFATEHIETNVELVRDWMTIPFISRMYHVRQHTLFEALEIPVQGNRDKSLKQLNEEYFPEVPGYVESTIKAAVLENLPPTIPAPPTAPPP
jgi:hypothetical protein